MVIIVKTEVKTFPKGWHVCQDKLLMINKPKQEFIHHNIFWEKTDVKTIGL